MRVCAPAPRLPLSRATAHLAPQQQLDGAPLVNATAVVTGVHAGERESVKYTFVK